MKGESEQKGKEGKEAVWQVSLDNNNKICLAANFLDVKRKVSANPPQTLPKGDGIIPNSFYKACVTLIKKNV